MKLQYVLHLHTREFNNCAEQQHSWVRSSPAVLLHRCCFKLRRPVRPHSQKRLTHAENYHRPSRTIHTQTHTLTPACAFLSHVFLTIDADASRRGHVGASHLVLNPKARLCAKNSTATIGIINIASPIPRHTSRPLQRYKICVEKHKAPLILER